MSSGLSLLRLLNSCLAEKHEERAGSLEVMDSDGHKKKRYRLGRSCTLNYLFIHSIINRKLVYFLFIVTKNAFPVLYKEDKNVRKDDSEVQEDKERERC